MPRLSPAQVNAILGEHITQPVVKNQPEKHCEYCNRLIDGVFFVVMFYHLPMKELCKTCFVAFGDRPTVKTSARFCWDGVDWVRC